MIKSLFNRKIELTKEEQKVENLVNLMLGKEDTDIEDDHESYSFMLSNRSQDCYIEINGSVTIINGETSTSRQFRLTAIEHFKKLIEREETRRYKENKAIIFNKTLTLLDKMEANLQ